MLLGVVPVVLLGVFAVVLVVVLAVDELVVFAGVVEAVVVVFAVVLDML